MTNEDQLSAFLSELEQEAKNRALAGDLTAMKPLVSASMIIRALYTAVVDLRHQLRAAEAAALSLPSDPAEEITDHG